MSNVFVTFRAREWARTRNVQQLVFSFVQWLSFFLNLGTFFFRRVMLIPPSSGWNQMGYGTW